MRTGGIYVVVAWAIIQAVDVIAPRLGAPDWTVKLVIILAITGLPIALILSWIFDLKREQSRAIGFVLIGMIIALVGFGTYWRVEPHTSSSKADANSVAVLPFVDMSPTKDQEYFGDGISEEIINVLTELPNLHVPARTSSFSFKGKELPISAIAQQLGVANVLEGSVRKAGNRVRITAELIDAKSDKHLWSESYDRDLSDVFAVQDEIARAIAEALQVHISGTLVASETANGHAHELYLKGLYYWNRRHAEELPQALEEFKDAAQEDTNYASAYAGIALTYAILPQYIASFDPKEASRLGKAAAQQALRLDPRAADAHAALGQIAQELDWDYNAAAIHYDQALKLDPHYATAHQWRGELYGVLGQNDAALREFDRAIELDPLSNTAQSGRGLALARMNRLDDAIVLYQNLVARDPDYQAGLEDLITMLVRAKRYQEAIAMTRGDTATAQVIEGIANPAMRPAALRILHHTAETKTGFVNYVADAYIALGLPDSAALFLNRKADGWAPSLAYVAHDPLYAALKPYPAYQEFLRKLHLQ